MYEFIVVISDSDDQIRLGWCGWSSRPYAFRRCEALPPSRFHEWRFSRHYLLHAVNSVDVDFTSRQHEAGRGYFDGIVAVQAAVESKRLPWFEVGTVARPRHSVLSALGAGFAPAEGSVPGAERRGARAGAGRRGRRRHAAQRTAYTVRVVVAAVLSVVLIDIPDLPPSHLYTCKVWHMANAAHRGQGASATRQAR